MNPHADHPTLRGSPAFRDLGGAPTDDGRRVKPRRFFRADALATLDAADRGTIDALGLRLVCDLRSASERERTACLTWLYPAPRRLQLDVSAGVNNEVAASIARLIIGPDPDAAAAMMLATYAALPHSAAPLLHELFQCLTDGEVPLLVHCTAGKDRTGFVTALILLAVGVTPEFVRADYLRGSGHDPNTVEQPSSRMLEVIVGRRLTPAESAYVHAVRPEYLDAALAAIERGWGTPLAYLERVAGLDAGRRQALRAHLLD